MDIQNYISSGKLELFVLGDLNETEQQEVLSMARKYPEIQEELKAIEAAMFAFDKASGKKPSAEVKDRIFSSLEASLPAQESPDRPGRPESVEKEVKLYPGANPWKPFAVAASLTAVLAIAAAAYFAYSYFDAEERYAVALEQNAILADDARSNQVRFDELDQSMERLLSGNFERIPMKGEGLPMQEDALVDVFWDKESSEVLLSVNQLADLDENSDYQLWAIGADGPVGIGLVNPSERLNLQHMQAAGAAQAFAITIEPRGGSESPTLEKLVVLGEVS
ncbi:Anti-sigma-K factor RskA [Cyclobacterium lianum]|uniref:Anti-sigma-K factor RskA n=1 Tax=Cyclobacterium lianum TaxID=388280 RepID=A0A1M7PE58_9BACT|nr:anti-sigma factor [Cyclobacterium lianum]SHN15288.1 Anti-sigma-K factor RskA [Cyclobacterium lianum]